MDHAALLIAVMTLPIVALFAFVGCFDFRELGPAQELTLVTLQFDYQGAATPINRVDFIIQPDGISEDAARIEMLASDGAIHFDATGWERITDIRAWKATVGTASAKGKYELVMHFLGTQDMQWTVWCKAYANTADDIKRPLFPPASDGKTHENHVRPDSVFKFHLANGLIEPG